MQSLFSGLESINTQTKRGGLRNRSIDKSLNGKLSLGQKGLTIVNQRERDILQKTINSHGSKSYSRSPNGYNKSKRPSAGGGLRSQKFSIPGEKKTPT